MIIYLCCFTSKASLSALPTSIKASTNSIMAAPGNSARYAESSMMKA